MRFASTSVRRRGGFTLVEMLVVIGIILLLIGILLPAINNAYRQSVRTRIADDIQAISMAIEHYKGQFTDIPRTSGNGDTPALKGSVLLCRAMLGLGPIGQDGADGPGFRTNIAINGVPQGPVCGPYLPADRFKVVAYPAGGVPASTFSNAALADREGKPILYYPGLRASDPKANNGYVTVASYSGTPVRPMFNSNDNVDLMTTVKFQHLMGDLNHNGKIDGTEQVQYEGEYILLSAGPDQQYGPSSTTTPIGPKNPCDDVTNFPR